MRTNIKSNPFLGSLRQVAIAIGKREGIKIIFSGSGAKTDGKTIYLPSSLPADDSEVEIMLRGYLDHEVGHIKHTNFDLPKPSHPLIHTFTNVFEDIRIEKAMGYEYPGCAVNLRENVHYLKESGRIKGPGKDTKPLSAALWSISYGARVKHLKNNLKEEASAYRKIAVKQLGEPVIHIIDHAISESGCLTSTAQARRLAEQTYDKLNKLLQEPPPEAPQPQPQQDYPQQDQDDQQQDGQGEGQGDEGSDKGDQDNQKSDNSSQNQDDSNDGDQGQETGSDASQSDDNGNGSPSPSDDGNVDPDSQDSGSGGSMTDKQRKTLQGLLDTSEQDLEDIEDELDVAKQSAEAIGKGDKAKLDHQDGTAGLNDTSGNTGEVETEASGAGGHIPHINEVSEESLKTVGLRGKLAGLFQASKLKRDNPKLTGVKIDRRAVHRLAANTPDTPIFEQRHEKVNNNTAITILVDKSSSMSGTRIITATAAALSIAKAVESMPDVSCSVGAFPINGSNGVLEIKRYGEKPKVPRFAIRASGNTPMDIGLRWAGQITWPRKENRKIVLVLTDGEPDNSYKAVQMAELLKENGIECYGIGIGAGTERNVKSLFGSNAKEIVNIEDLADAMFDTLIDAMTKRR